MMTMSVARVLCENVGWERNVSVEELELIEMGKFQNDENGMGPRQCSA